MDSPGNDTEAPQRKVVNWGVKTATTDFHIQTRGILNISLEIYSHNNMCDYTEVVGTAVILRKTSMNITSQKCYV